MNKKELYRKRIAEGKCTICGAQADNYYTRCNSCRDKFNKYCRERRAEMKRNNICYFCGKPTDGKHSLCPECSKRQNAKNAADKKALKEMGICPICSRNALVGEEKRCIECRAKYRYNNSHKSEAQKMRKKHQRIESYRRVRDFRRNNNLCWKCGTRARDIGYATCGKCRAILRLQEQEKRQQSISKTEYRKVNGLCLRCDNPVKEGYKLCQRHYDLNCKASHSPQAVEARQRIKKRYYANAY